MNGRSTHEDANNTCIFALNFFGTYLTNKHNEERCLPFEVSKSCKEIKMPRRTAGLFSAPRFFFVPGVSESFGSAASRNPTTGTLPESLRT
jgi:hypothetical protein